MINQPNCPVLTCASHISAALLAAPAAILGCFRRSCRILNLKKRSSNETEGPPRGGTAPITNTRAGAAIYIPLTDWDDHRPRPRQQRDIAMRAVTVPQTPVTASCCPDISDTAGIEPGASTGNGSHRRRIIITTRDRRPIADRVTSPRHASTIGQGQPRRLSAPRCCRNRRSVMA